MAQNAKDTLGVNFLNDLCMLSNEDCIAIYQKILQLLNEKNFERRRYRLLEESISVFIGWNKQLQKEYKILPKKSERMKNLLISIIGC